MSRKHTATSGERRVRATRWERIKDGISVTGTVGGLILGAIGIGVGYDLANRAEQFQQEISAARPHTDGGSLVISIPGEATTKASLVAIENSGGSTTTLTNFRVNGEALVEWAVVDPATRTASVNTPATIPAGEIRYIVFFTGTFTDYEATDLDGNKVKISATSPPGYVMPGEKFAQHVLMLAVTSGSPGNMPAQIPN